MNIDAYNLDSLRMLVRKLEKENQNLKQKLNEANIPYNSENIFERDLVEASNSIIISSPTIMAEKIERFIQILKPRQEAGVKVSVILTTPENRCYGNADFYLDLVGKMKETGIQVIMVDEDTECFAVIDREFCITSSIQKYAVLSHFRGKKAAYFL